jgi:hypothetical protein
MLAHPLQFHPQASYLREKGDNSHATMKSDPNQ